jgi:hypothetical protein
MSVKNRYVSLPMAALISVLLTVAALSAQSQSDRSRSGQWRIAGQNLNNTWSQPAEHSISPTNVQNLIAFDATTGNILWNFASGGTVIDGASIVDSVLYWGSGYRNIQGTGNNKVFAFTLARSEHGGEHSDNQGQK